MAKRACPGLVSGGTSDRESAVIDLYLNTGKSYREIGDWFGYTRNKVAGILSHHLPKDAPRRGTQGGSRNVRLPANDNEMAVIRDLTGKGQGIPQVMIALRIGRIRATRLIEEIYEETKNGRRGDRFWPTGCRYQFGDPREDDFYFCGQPQQTGQSYCAYHYAVCYRSDDRKRKRKATPAWAGGWRGAA